jgi:hypothetical protein
MSPEIRAKMDGLCFQMAELQAELKLNPARDAQFCSGVIGQAIAQMNMRLGSEWGIKMAPRAREEE